MGSNWTQADIDKLRERGLKIIDTRIQAPVMKASKYKNKKTVVNGIEFDSIKEAKRYNILLFMQKQGFIGMLELQVEYELNNGGTHSLKYIADFRYIDSNTGETIVEDCKGALTAVYKKKRRLMKTVRGIIIKET